MSGSHALRSSLILLTLLSCTATADELRSTLDDQYAVAVTIYNNDLALVKDQRQIQLANGVGRLALRDVSARIRPETALLKSLTGAFRVLEQNFDFDLLTPQALLQKFVGREVEVVTTNPATGVERREPAEVLAASSGAVLRLNDRIETGLPGRIVYRDVPANLRDRPTLVVELDNRTPAPQKVELSYLTAGLGWKADYVAELNARDDRLDLSGWVTLDNTSGTSYRNARLQLVAGDVNRVAGQPRAPMATLARMEAKAMDAAPMTQEALLEYHLYTLERPTTIAENQSKQVALLAASAVPVHKELLFRGADYYYRGSHGALGQKLKADVFVEFANRESANLGMPLPKGIVRVYKKDSGGNAQFVGEDRIDHTAKNSTVRLKLGQAFDVTADKKQTDFKKLSTAVKDDSAYESAYEIVLHNGKDEAVTVSVQEPVPGDWTLLASSLPGKKVSSNLLAWQVTIPASGETVLTYRVRVR